MKCNTSSRTTDTASEAPLPAPWNDSLITIITSSTTTTTIRYDYTCHDYVTTTETQQPSERRQSAVSQRDSESACQLAVMCHCQLAVYCCHSMTRSRLPTLMKASTARFTSSSECDADSCTRIRALSTHQSTAICDNYTT